MNYIRKYRMISYISLLFLICLGSFLVAKYIVRVGIEKKEIPVDTSVRI